ncbi:Uncharacterised protein [Klebsiella variicola]|nr:Uncharacterised protein [Klebsiella variicola]VAT78266.1 Uncharacterised protein [Klebsiella variicola]
MHVVINQPSAITAFFWQLYPVSIVYAKDASIVFVM